MVFSNKKLRRNPFFDKNKIKKRFFSEKVSIFALGK